MSSFETQARALRYRTLGQACAQSDHPVLLVAHHSDDQAETVMLRAVQGQRGAALCPLRQITKLPDCTGMYGIDSNPIQHLSSSNYLINPNNTETPPLGTICRPGQEPSRLQSIFQAQGISIMRPLLSFSKVDLIHLCQNHDVRWEEDATNRDVSITPRNAIRHLLQSERLPLALRNNSLLQLAQKANSRSILINRTALDMFNECTIKRFDLRVGVLLLSYESQMTSNYRQRVKDQGLWPAVAVEFLRLLFHAVSPDDHVSVQSLEHVFESCFGSQSDTARKDVFTAAGVLCNFRVTSTESGWIHNWTLSRQPSYSVRTSVPSLLEFPSGSSSGQTPHLIDGRYWLVLENKTPYRVHVRLLTPQDLQQIYAQFKLLRDGVRRMTRLRAALDYAAPDKLKWTIPVIAVEDPDFTETLGSDEKPPRRNLKSPNNLERRDGQADVEPLGRVVALPTFGQIGHVDMGLCEPDFELGANGRHEHASEHGSMLDPFPLLDPFIEQAIRWKIQYKDVGAEWRRCVGRGKFLSVWDDSPQSQAQELALFERRFAALRGSRKEPTARDEEW